MIIEFKDDKTELTAKQNNELFYKRRTTFDKKNSIHEKKNHKLCGKAMKILFKYSCLFFFIYSPNIKHQIRDN